MVLIKCRITQDYCYNDDYGNCHDCDVAKNNTTYLRPCPFCGCNEIGIFKKNMTIDFYFVRCKSCMATIDNLELTTKEKAIAAWNRRDGDE